jgi:hypothetical protein
MRAYAPTIKSSWYDGLSLQEVIAIVRAPPLRLSSLKTSCHCCKRFQNLQNNQMVTKNGRCNIFLLSPLLTDG